MQSTDPPIELDPPPWQRVETSLVSTARLIRVTYDNAMAILDLNLTSAMMIAYVADYGPTTQTTLADRIDVGRASAGSVIDRLEARGLVERAADVADRRVWLITLTDSGAAIAGDIARIDERVRTQLRRGIGREQRQMLASLLDQMQRNMLSPTPTNGDNK
ncbi:MAG: MarR family transcriptional regulator [Actinomycetia bacterium]|nr:MarR family transcriptional regulator [Actinomycetes bacterium]